MKKLLALVLALVMTLSLATVSTNAAFEDAADISYTEAAEVLSAVGVFVGDGKNFAPKAGLNREQAAKLVAYLALGEDVAEALPAVAMFDDVAASSWAAKYIAYCADAGIITGDGAGKFFPTAPVDGYAFAKMVLCALGYNAEAEGYVGSNWSINVAKDAKDLDLAKGGVDLSKALTREQAAQVMFNAIKCKPVDEYDQTGTSVTIAGVEVNTAWGEAKLESKTYYELTWDTNNGALTYIDGPSEIDDFNRLAHSWMFEGKSVGTYADEAAKFVITKKMTAKDVATMFKGYTLGGYKVNEDAALLAGHGMGYRVADDATATGFVNGTNTAYAISHLTDNGKAVEIYAGSDMKIDQIVVINYAVDEVTDITTNAKTGAVTYKFKTVGNYTNTEDTATVVFAGEVAKGDVVTVAATNDELYVYPTTKMTGTVASVNQSSVATINGESFKKQYSTSVSFAPSATNTNFWLDQFGFVVKSDAVASATTNFAYVLDLATKATTGFDVVPSAQVKVLLADGTLGIYDIEFVKKAAGYYMVDADGQLLGNPFTPTTADSVTTYVNDYLLNDDTQTYLYEISGNNIRFKEAAKGNEKTFVAGMSYTNDADTTAQYVQKNDTSIFVHYLAQNDTAVLNSATTFIFYDAGDEEVEKVVVGNTKLGDYKFHYVTGNDVVMTANKAGTAYTAKYVFVVGGFEAESGNVDAYGYMDPSKYVQTKSGDDNIRTYTLTKPDGTTMSVTAKNTFVTAGAGVYSYKSDNTVANENKLGAAWAKFGAATEAGGVVTIAGHGSFNKVDATKVVDLSDDFDAIDDGYVIVVVTEDSSSAPTNVLETVYIVDAGEVVPTVYASVGGVFHATFGDALADATSGETVEMAADVATSTAPATDANVEQGDIPVAFTLQAGATLDGNGYTMTVSGQGGKTGNAQWLEYNVPVLMAGSGTIKDLTIDCPTRGIVCYKNASNVTVTLDNVTILNSERPINVTSDGTPYTLNVSNCNLAGKISYELSGGVATFTNCTFAEGTVISAHGATTNFVNCNINPTVV